MPLIIDVDELQYTADACKGPRVATAAPGVIQKGTVIATFTAGGLYPNSSDGKRHPALYLSHDANGIKVIDQWVGKAIPNQRTLTFVGFLEPRREDQGDQYYVVEITESEQIEGQTGVAEQTLGP